MENGLISRLLFSELCKIMVNKVTFVGFRGDDPNRRPWIRPSSVQQSFNARYELKISCIAYAVV